MRRKAARGGRSRLLAAHRRGHPGAQNHIELNRNDPEGWHLEILELLAQGGLVAIEVRVPHETLGISFVTGFYRVGGGQIQRGTEYWVDEKSQQAPAWRSRFTERR